MTQLYRITLGVLALVSTLPAVAEQRYEARLLPLAPGYAPFGVTATSGGQLGGFGYEGLLPRALLWETPFEMPLNLHPGGFVGSAVFGVSNRQQVGMAYEVNEAQSHAILWNGSSSGFIDLHPIGFGRSFANDTTGSVQVGGMNTCTLGPLECDRTQAVLWRGSAASAVVLHDPTKYTHTVATAIHGEQQVGVGVAHDVMRATAWRGTADSLVELHPEGWHDSHARDVFGERIVGRAAPLPGESHAALWTGVAHHFIDLHPLSALRSDATSTNGRQHVGIVSVLTPTGAQDHAFLWDDASGGTIDLHTFLPQAYVASRAGDVDEAGNVVGEATTATGETHAVIWLVPEPHTLSSLLISAIFFMRRPRS